MPTISDYFATRAPDYVGDTRLPQLEIQAKLQTGNVFKDCGNFELAVFLRMMHWIAMDTRGGLDSADIGGMVKRKKEGGLEIEYLQDFTLSGSDPDLSQTRWGMELIGLRKACVVTFRNRFTEPS